MNTKDKIVVFYAPTAISFLLGYVAMKISPLLFVTTMPACFWITKGATKQYLTKRAAA